MKITMKSNAELEVKTEFYSYRYFKDR